jgi:hypothetical protein
MKELDSYKVEAKGKIEEIKKMKESLEYKQIFNYIDQENDDSNKFILIIPGEEYISDDEILCFSENSINKIIRNYREWLIECTGQQLMDDQGQPTDDKSVQIKESPEFYVGLPIDSDGMLGFVDIRQVKTLTYLVKNGLNFCYLVPTDEMISHTVSLKNVYGNYPDWVSANHCQRGSNILIYNIEICDGQNCNKENTRQIMSDYINNWTEPKFIESNLYQEDIDEIQLEMEQHEQLVRQQEVINMEDQLDDQVEERLLPRRLFEDDDDEDDEDDGIDGDASSGDALSPRRLFFGEDSDDSDDSDSVDIIINDEQINNWENYLLQNQDEEFM